MQRSDLLGVWRLVEATSGGRKLHTGETHLVVHEHETWEVWPSSTYYEGEPGPEHAFEFEAGDPAKFAVILPHGRFCYLVECSGDTLRRRLGSVFGRYPKSIDGPEGNLYRYERETDPALVDRLHQPPARTTRMAVTHGRLGDLVYDANVDWWSGKLPFGGHDVDVNVTVPSQLERSAALDRAASAIERLDCDALKLYAADQLLALHNDTWRDEDDDETDAEGFAARMIPRALTVGEDGSVTAWFDDGDLFWGHSIHVSLDAELRPTDAGIAG